MSSQILTRRDILRGSLALAGLTVLSGCSRLSSPAISRKPRQIGFLGFVPETYHEAFVQGLQARGYVEGQDVVVERRYADGDSDRLPTLAAELVQLPADVIVVAGVGPGAVSAPSLPIVAVLTDAVERHTVVSLARPGGQITGINVSTPSLAAKRVQLLKEAAPSLSHLTIVESGDQTARQAVAMITAASSLGLTLDYIDLLATPSITQALRRVRSVPTGALISVDGPVPTAHRAAIIEIAATTGMPGIYPQRAFADDGGLMSYGPNYTEIFRGLATFVDKIFKGGKPGEIPMEQPTTLDFVVNLTTANTLGLTIPATILQQATDIIQ